MLTKQETLLGRGVQTENKRVREPKRIALPSGLQSLVLLWWDEFPGFLWSIILTQSPSWWCTHCSLKMNANEKDSGRFWPFLNSSGWWWLLSSVFLTRISCHKITHTNSYCDAWPGWVVSVSASPNITIQQIKIQPLPLKREWKLGEKLGRAVMFFLLIATFILV